MEPLVSVVIPVYNVEKYLRQCLDSVINQTYKNLEIVCVNDCSTDSSPQILEEYAKSDSRIRILNNKQNLGLGLTRNEGIKIAKGEFVHCLDSDDWMELNAYETLINEFEDDIDAIRFPYYSYDEITKQTEIVGYNNEDFLYKKTNLYDNPACCKHWNSSAWIKIFRRDFLISNNLFYNDYRCFEDVEYAMRAILCAKNIKFINTPLLNYRANRKGSLLSKKTKFTNCILKDTKWANEKAKTLSKEVKTALLDYIYELLVFNSLDAYYVNNLSFQEMKKIFQENIDMKYFTIPLARKLTQKVLEYPHIKFFLSYNVRRFIKEHFPEFTKNYFELKKRIQAWMKKSA